mgnify:CR=1 FL=1|jgi:hypothetical protein
MTKEELLTRLSDIEWNDFEVKEASEVFPNPCGRLSVRFPILPEDG